MSTTEILAQLPELTPADRDAVRARLDAIDGEMPLTPEERRLVQARLSAYHENPGAAVSWAVAETEIRKQAGL